jgi:putative methionine-R-sulfoxide reductase with GAF domain
MTCAAFVPGHSGGAVPVFHRIPYSSDRPKRPDTSDQVGAFLCHCTLRVKLVESGFRSHDAGMLTRDYQSIVAGVGATGDRDCRMRTTVASLWSALKDTGVAWVGFYVHEGGDELVLGPMRDKPACSPIGLHGACGRVFTTRQPLVVRDVKELGENYIACDPRDRSEVVVPLLQSDGTCWGVLDLDSHDVGSFSDTDVTGLLDVLRAAGLTQ